MASQELSLHTQQLFSKTRELNGPNRPLMRVFKETFEPDHLNTSSTDSKTPGERMTEQLEELVRRLPQTGGDLALPYLVTGTAGISLLDGKSPGITSSIPFVLFPFEEEVEMLRPNRGSSAVPAIATSFHPFHVGETPMYSTTMNQLDRQSYRVLCETAVSTRTRPMDILGGRGEQVLVIHPAAELTDRILGMSISRRGNILPEDFTDDDATTRILDLWKNPQSPVAPIRPWNAGRWFDAADAVLSSSQAAHYIKNEARTVVTALFTQ